MADESSIRDFAASFQSFIQTMSANAPAQESPFVALLREHFAAEPATLPIITDSFEVADHANLQLAIDDFIASDGRTATLTGLHAPDVYRGITLADVVAGDVSATAPVEYVNLPAGDDRSIVAVQRGLYLIHGDGGPTAILVRGTSEYTYRRRLTIDIMAGEKRAAETLLHTLRRSMRARNVYRGQIISLGMDEMHSLEVHFHRLPRIDRQDIVLPAGLLERIERQTVGFARVSEKLRSAGRHLRRGLLLHGAPGTGKTLTAMYLAAQMKDRTILLLTGRGLGMIGASCSLARALEPATVILEDVDLIAEERTRQNACGAVLFELLNQMDGLGEDADVLFILTTNRPDILEPALAARPGRIDQAIEVPLPDAGSRRRLFDLYSRGMRVEVDDVEQFVRRTEGVSAAFIRELMRRAALIAADAGGEIVVTEHNVDEALHDLIITGGALTRSLLGARAAET
jgi:hypothetical protein